MPERSGDDRPATAPRGGGPAPSGAAREATRSGGRRPPWSGVFPYLPTPVDGAGRLVRRHVEALVGRVLAGGVHGVTPLGSSGEAPLVADRVRAEMTAAVLDAVAGRVPVVPGVCGFGTADLVRQAVRAERLGADGVLVMLLAYFPLGRQEIVSAVGAVAEAVTLPLVMYHHPALCGVTLDDETVRLLHEKCRVTAVKDASGRLDTLARWRASAGAGLQIFAASAVSPASAMASGACGWMSGPATVFPGESVAVFDAVTAGDLDAARVLEAALVPTLEFFRRTGPGRAVKALLTADGRGVGAPVPPLADFTPTELKAAAACLRRVRSSRPPF